MFISSFLKTEEIRYKNISFVLGKNDLRQELFLLPFMRNPTECAHLHEFKVDHEDKKIKIYDVHSAV